MKQNKNNQIDTVQPVEFTLYDEAINPNGFRVTGDYDSLAPLYEDMKQQVGRQVVSKVATQVVPEVVETVPSEPVLATGFKANLQVTLYDFCNGTNFKAALQAERQLRKDTAFAQRIGILGVEKCAKHRRALQAVRSIR